MISTWSGLILSRLIMITKANKAENMFFLAKYIHVSRTCLTFFQKLIFENLILNKGFGQVKIKLFFSQISYTEGKSAWYFGFTEFLYLKYMDLLFQKSPCRHYCVNKQLTFWTYKRRVYTIFI